MSWVAAVGPENRRGVVRDSIVGWRLNGLTRQGDGEEVSGGRKEVGGRMRKEERHALRVGYGGYGGYGGWTRWALAASPLQQRKLIFGTKFKVKVD